MYTAAKVNISVVSTQAVMAASTREQKEAFGLKVCNVASAQVIVATKEVTFEWRNPVVFDCEVPVTVMVTVYPRGTFDPGRDALIDLLVAIVETFKEARSIFPGRCETRFCVKCVRNTLVAARWGPSVCLPDKRFQ